MEEEYQIESSQSAFLQIIETMYGPVEYILISAMSYLVYLVGVVIIVIALIKLRKRANHPGIKMMIWSLVMYAALSVIYFVAYEYTTELQDTILAVVDSIILLFGAVGFSIFIKSLAAGSPNKLSQQDAASGAAA